MLNPSAYNYTGDVFLLNEADTCRTYILPKLKAAHWEDDYIIEQYVLTPGRIVPLGGSHTSKTGLRPDYVLCIRRNIHIAVVEAKADVTVQACHCEALFAEAISR